MLAEEPPVGHVLPLHPMTVADILDGAFRAWRAVVGPAVLLVLLVAGPFELVSNLLVQLRAPRLLSDASPFGLVDAIDLATAGLLALVGLAGTVVSIYVAAAVIALVVDVDRGGAPQLGAAMRAALRPTGNALVAMLVLVAAGLATFVAAIVVALIPLLGVVALLLTGPVLVGVAAALGALVVPIAVVERRGPLATLGRAVWVLRVRFWRTVGITWLVLLVLAGVSTGLATLLDLVAVVAGPGAWVVMAISGVLLSVVQIPVLALAALLVHLDARILHEAYDLEVRLRRLAAA